MARVVHAEGLYEPALKRHAVVYQPLVPALQGGVGFLKELLVARELPGLVAQAPEGHALLYLPVAVGGVLLPLGTRDGQVYDLVGQVPVLLAVDYEQQHLGFGHLFGFLGALYLRPAQRVEGVLHPHPGVGGGDQKHVAGAVAYGAQVHGGDPVQREGGLFLYLSRSCADEFAHGVLLSEN